MEYDDRDLDDADTEALQALLESVPEYAQRITGYPLGPSDALSALLSVPPGFDPAGKHAIGLWDGPSLVAFADVLLGYPDPAFAYIGLVVVHADRQGQGLGRQLHNAVLDRVRDHSAAVVVRLGVIATVAATVEPFIRALGYTPTGEHRPYRYDKLVSTVSLWTRPIIPGAGEPTPPPR
jgi:GNAT superfamily N-acetyltransferase